MKKQDRLDSIIKLINEKGHLSVADLSRFLDVTEVTIRSDLSALEQKGFLQRTHGGAMVNSSYSALFLHEKFNLNFSEEKMAIGRAAAELINPWEWVFLAGGTTCAAIAKALVDVPGIKVITNNILAALVLCESKSAEILVTNGQLQPEHMILDGELLSRFFDNIYVSKAFFGIASVDIDNGYFVSPSSEINTIRTVRSHAKDCYLVADSKKFGYPTLTSIGALDIFENIITDSGIPEHFLKKYKELGINVTIADEIRD